MHKDFNLSTETNNNNLTTP